MSHAMIPSSAVSNNCNKHNKTNKSLPKVIVALFLRSPWHASPCINLARSKFFCCKVKKNHLRLWLKKTWIVRKSNKGNSFAMAATNNNQMQCHRKECIQEKDKTRRWWWQMRLAIDKAESFYVPPDVCQPQRDLPRRSTQETRSGHDAQRNQVLALQLQTPQRSDCGACSCDNIHNKTGKHAQGTSNNVWNAHKVHCGLRCYDT